MASLRRTRLWLAGLLALALALPVLPAAAQSVRSTNTVIGSGTSFSLPAATQLLSAGSYPVFTNGVSTTGSTTISQNTFTVTDPSGASIGTAILSAGIFANGTIVTNVSGNTITASNNALATNASAPIQFGNSRFNPYQFGTTSFGAKNAYFGAAAKGNTTWAYQYVPAVDAPGDYSAVFLSPVGQGSAFFGSHTADNGQANNSATLNAFFESVNDNPTVANTSWSMYAQCEVTSTSLSVGSFCAELSPLNYGTTVTLDPYTPNLTGMVDTLRLDAGNGKTGLNNTSTLIHMLGNGASARSGIVVGSDALDFTTDSHACALCMPTAAAVQWYNAAGQKTWGIYDATSGAVANTLVLSDAVATFSQKISVPVGSAAVPSLQVGTGGYGLYQGAAALGFSSAGSQVAYMNTNDIGLSAVGFIGHNRTISCASSSVTLLETDWHAIITPLPAAGNCAITLAVTPANGKQVVIDDGAGTAATHNLVITPAAGNIDGTATATINTNYGSWGGVYTGAGYKTENYQNSDTNGNVLTSGYTSITGTTLPTQAAGTLGLGGTNTIPTLNGNAEGNIFLTATGGINIMGQGSSNDISFVNESGGVGCAMNANTGLLTCSKFVPTGSGLAGNAFYLPLANTPAVSANGTEAMSWTSTTTKAFGTFVNSGIASTAQADVVCTTSAGTFSYQVSATGCASSGAQFKNIVSHIAPDDALAGILKLDPAVWTYKDTAEYGSAPFVGLVAQNVCAMDDRLCARDKAGEPVNYDKYGTLAYAIGAIQAQQIEIAGLKEALAHR